MPAFDIRPASRDEVLPLFVAHHGYKSLGKMLTYCFAVYEDDKPVAAFAWVPPPPGASKAVCPEAPHGVLALSRMVAVPKDQRRLKHISKPLRYQMTHLIDRTRWPVLVTYADEGQGHNGFVYRCSGWLATARAKRNTAAGLNGERVSTYSNGKRSAHAKSGHTWLQRFEHWAVAPGYVASWMVANGWVRCAVPGKVWASGNPAYTYVKINPDTESSLPKGVDIIDGLST